MQLNFQKRQKVKLNSTFTIDTRHENINQMSLNNALSILHNKVNILEKMINNSEHDISGMLIQDNNIDKNGILQYEEIIFDLQNKVHTMEKNMNNLNQQITTLNEMFQKNCKQFSDDIQSIKQQSNGIMNNEIIQRVASSIPDENELKVMVNSILFSNTRIQSEPKSENSDKYNKNDNYVKLYDISYENFIDSSLLNDVNN